MARPEAGADRYILKSSLSWHAGEGAALPKLVPRFESSQFEHMWTGACWKMEVTGSAQYPTPALRRIEVKQCFV
jgi:hypothetical protein